MRLTVHMARGALVLLATGCGFDSSVPRSGGSAGNDRDAQTGSSPRRDAGDDASTALGPDASRGSGGTGGSGGSGGTGGTGGSDAGCDPDPEVCEGMDDDCDGLVDEGCACRNGTTQPCYTGTEATRGVGSCSDGSQTCVDGQWGSCSGDVTPALELCDSLDNDCSGTPDDGSNGCGGVCPLANAPGTPCDGPGDTDGCADGEHVCGTLNSTVCEDGGPDLLDPCGGGDQNCNGVVDDGNNACGGSCPLPQVPGLACDGNDGDACTEGNWLCSGLNGVSCSDATSSNVELCDAIDQDCDGDIVEGICSLANATSVCVSSSCNLVGCNNAFCDLDGESSTGCEHSLDTAPSCPGMATFLGSVSGDTSSPDLTFTGRGQRYFQVRVDESASGGCASEDLCVEVELQPNGAEIDYDLYARCDGCATTSTYSASSIEPAGGPDLVQLSWPEAELMGCATGSDSGRDVFVFVYLYDAFDCSTYTLTVRGDACGPNPTCPAK